MSLEEDSQAAKDEVQYVNGTSLSQSISFVK